jgi:hypothetical protein
MRPPTNTEIEMRWVDARNDLYDVFDGARAGGDCLIPVGAVVSFDEGKGYLQTSAYEGSRLRVEKGWHRGQRVAVLSRER